MFVKKGEQADYLQAALSWDQNRVRSALRSRRLAWIVAGCACGLSAVSVAAVAMLAPLKTVAPYVIKVDHSTGETQIVTALKGPGPRTYDEAVNRYFLAQYVRLREGWLPEAARENFYTVSLMSDQGEQGRWLSSISPSDKNSAQLVYGPKAFVSVSIRTISFLSPTVAQVRFTKLVTQGDNPTSAQNWNALITFKYSAAPEMEKDRTLNPLGFQVINYRSDPEA